MYLIQLIEDQSIQLIQLAIPTFLPILLADITSSCLQEFPAATAFAVAVVIGLVYLITSSAVATLSTLSVPSKPCRSSVIAIG